MEERAQMFKSKVTGSVQEVIFPDFPDDDNTVTTTVTKSRRVSFGTNFIKEFIVGSAISAQCVSEYEQAVSSSDSSNPNSSLSAVESGILDPPFIPDTSKIHPTEPPIFKPPDFNPTEPPKQTTFSRTICFSADSPTVDMEFTEGCISLAKSILDKKNKEMTVIIQAKSKEPKEDRIRKEEMTKIFDGSEVEMSMTRCLKSRENIQEGRRFESESTKIFNKFDDEMSITRCDRGFKMRQSRIADESDFMMESSKENRMPLDLIMRQLDRDDSDTDVFNPEKSFSDMLNSRSFDLSYESEKLNLNESMDISRDFQNVAPAKSQELFDSPKEDVLLNTPTQHLSLNSPTQHLPLNSPTQHLSFRNSKEDSLLGSPMEVVSAEEVVLESNEKRLSLECSKQLSMEVSQEGILMESPEEKDLLGTPMESLSFKVLPSESPGLENHGEDLPLNSSKGDSCLEENPENSKEHIAMESPKQHSMSQTLLESSKEFMSLESPKQDLQQIPLESCEGNVAMESPNLTMGSPKEQLSLDTPRENFPIESPPLENPNEQSTLETPRHSLPPEEHIQFETPKESSEQHPSTPKHHLSLESPEEHLPLESPKQQPSLDTPVRHLPTPNEQHSLENHKEDISSVSPEEHPSMGSQQEHIILESSREPPTPNKQTLSDDTGEQLIDKFQESEKTPVVSLPDIISSDEIDAEIIKPPENEDTPLEQSHSEPFLMDIKITETLKEQSKETNCLWTLQDIRYPRTKSPGLLSINFSLLQSSTTMEFTLKKSKKRSIDCCSIITNKAIHFKEERTPIHPEYNQVLQFGFKKQEEFFNNRSKKLTAISEIPYFLDEINSYTRKINTYLEQMYEVLISYPGSVLKGTRLSFRLFSYPLFFSTTVTVDLANLYTVSDMSLSFEHAIKKINEKRIANIFQDCLKHKNCLCEFIIRSNEYIIDAEQGTGYVSKRGHIRLLPEELRL